MRKWGRGKRIELPFSGNNLVSVRRRKGWGEAVVVPLYDSETSPALLKGKTKS